MTRWSIPAGSKLAVASGGRALTKIWDPSMVPGVIGWWDISDLGSVTLSGLSIMQANDKSGNGNHLISDDAGVAPEIYGYNLGGRRYAWFSGTEEMHTDGNPFGTTISNACFMCVYREWNRQNSTLFTLTGSDTSGNRWQSHCVWGNGDIYFDVGGTASPNRLQVASGYAEQTHHINGFKCSTTDDVQEIWLDGTLLDSDASGHSVTVVDDIFIGSANGQGYVDGDFGEGILFDGAISDTERQKLEGYLAYRWLLQGNLPGGHPYKTAPPVFK